MLFNTKARLISVCALICMLLQPVFAGADESSDKSTYQNKLDRLQKSILRIQEHLKNTRGRRGHILTELKELESNIGNNARALQKTEKQVSTLNGQVGQLRTELTKLTADIKNQQVALADQVRAAYVQGSQQSLKMLLNQQNPAEMGRIQVYFDYLNRARQQEITRFMDAIEAKHKKEKQLKEALNTQKKALSDRKEQKRSLQKQRRKRNDLLAQLDIKISNQEQTLTDLEVSRNKIEDLLKSLGELLADIPAAPGEQRPFEQQQGHLPWPVKGPFLARFGQPKNQGDLKWNGVLIGAPYGTPVRTISHGRVAFSDWLQGFGFITIVDHGDGYMSLYGHNESLFKQAGDWVITGEVIATTGDSGGQRDSGLYFEIRSRGKPVNPTSWCSSSTGHTASK